MFWKIKSYQFTESSVNGLFFSQVSIIESNFFTLKKDTKNETFFNGSQSQLQNTNSCFSLETRACIFSQ